MKENIQHNLDIFIIRKAKAAPRRTTLSFKRYAFGQQSLRV